MSTLPVPGKRKNIVIRDLDDCARMREVEELQKEIWGIPDLDVVPYSHLVAAKAAGGVVLGAFEGETLVGFVYGFVSFEHGQVAHHSHMLAVKPDYRNLDLGYTLKMAQRERVLQQGIRFMTWTFDPLQSLNAYFNFNKLGVVSDRYLVNFYGEDAPSFLHRNGTDRLWVTWPLKKNRTTERVDYADLEQTPASTLVQLDLSDSPFCNTSIAMHAKPQLLIEIPGDINALQHRDAELAVEWREATRWAFSKALPAGYLVQDFYRVQRDEQRLGVYLLTRNTLENYL